MADIAIAVPMDAVLLMLAGEIEPARRKLKAGARYHLTVSVDGAAQALVFSWLEIPEPKRCPALSEEPP